MVWDEKQAASTVHEIWGRRIGGDGTVYPAFAIAAGDGILIGNLDAIGEAEDRRAFDARVRRLRVSICGTVCRQHCYYTEDA